METDAWRIQQFGVSLTAASPHTISAYLSDVNLFIEWVGRQSIVTPDAVTKDIVRQYIGFLTTMKMAKRTTGRKLAALRRYFGWMVRNQQISIDPTIGVRTPSDTGRLPKVLTNEQLGALLQTDDTEQPDWKIARDTAVIELLYGSGLRVSELCSLDVDSINVKQLAVSVMGKGGKERRVPVGEPSLVALKQWVALRTEVVANSSTVALFVNSRGTRLGTATCGASSTHGLSHLRIPMRCATRMPLICWTTAPTFARCRNCWATPMWRPLSATRMSARSA